MNKPILSWKAIIFQLSMAAVNLAAAIVFVLHGWYWTTLVNAVAFLICGLVGIDGLIDRIKLRRMLTYGGKPLDVR